MNAEAKGLSIICIDDEPLNLSILEEFIADFGHSCVSFDSGVEADHYIQDTNNPIDLILCDNLMPGFTGIDLIRKLKVNEMLKHIPIVLISASTEKAQINDALELGASGFLQKPFVDSDLQSTIERLFPEKKHA